MTKDTTTPQPEMTQKQADLVREVIAEFGHTPEALFGPDGLIKQMTKRFVEQALDAEMQDHLGYPPHASEGRGSGNNRNGKSQKHLVTDSGTVDIQVPRDRKGTFEPKLVEKRQRRLEGFDEKVLYLYSQGLTTRDIADQLHELYGTEVSPTLISNITDRVLEQVRAFQTKPLDAVYPVVYFDALVVKSRQEGRVQNRSVYVALGLNLQGKKELLGLWVSPTEGAKFWLGVFTELKNRGMADCFIACVDGLTGLPEAIETVFPKTQVQLCIVHKIRSSLKYVSYKQRKQVAADLKPIYTASTIVEAEKALDAFEEKYRDTLPAVAPSWRKDFDRLTLFMDYPQELRTILYTTNAIESLNYSLRRVLKKRAAFPNDESILKVLFLAMERIEKKWSMPIPNWKLALNQLFILFGDRFPQHD